MRLHRPQLPLEVSIMRACTIVAAMTGALSASSLSAQELPERVDVTMSNYKFEPAAIHLHRGAPYVITLHNQARGGHSFEAHGFFAAAQMPAADRARIR